MIESNILDHIETSDAEKRALATGMTKEERDRSDRLAQHRRLYPLPDQMPRYVILKTDFDVFAKKGKVLKFIDDGWDGSVADAFSRVSLSTYRPSSSRPTIVMDPPSQSRTRSGGRSNWIGIGQ